jgi:hypothetical protein
MAEKKNQSRIKAVIVTAQEFAKPAKDGSKTYYATTVTIKDDPRTFQGFSAESGMFKPGDSGEFDIWTETYNNYENWKIGKPQAKPVFAPKDRTADLKIAALGAATQLIVAGKIPVEKLEDSYKKILGYLQS